MSTKWLPAFLLVGLGEVLRQAVLWLARCLPGPFSPQTGSCCRDLQVSVNPPAPDYGPESVGELATQAPTVGPSLLLLEKDIGALL